MHKSREQADRLRGMWKLLAEAEAKYQEYLNDENMEQETLDEEYESLQNLRAKVKKLQEKPVQAELIV